MDQIKRLEDMKVGRVVVYRNSTDEETFHNGEPIPYKIIEDRGDRVLMEVVWYAHEIRPQTVALKSDLRISFCEHTDVPVPDFVNFDTWRDTAWHNDETASACLKLDDTYDLRVWIYSDDYVQQMRERYPEGHPWHNEIKKYSVCLDSPEGMTMGRPCNDDNILQTIEEFKSNFLTLSDTEEWC